MGLREWFTRRSGNHAERKLRQWRQEWVRVAGSANGEEISRLSDELERLGLAEDDVEIEREMVQALIDRNTLAAAIQTSGLPRIETGHRVVHGEPCHYSEPASMVDEESQPAGRLLLTAGRVVFVGSGKTAAMPWHSISTALQMDRDVVLVR